MPLHPDIAEVLATLPPHRRRTRSTRTRCAPTRRRTVPPSEDRLPLHAVEDVVARTVGRATCPCGSTRRSTPTSYGLLVYFHGGAFFLGSLEHARPRRALAGHGDRATRSISVGYRLAPEAAFPAGLEDCYAVVRWAADNGERAAPGTATILAVAGDSSGGTFVAAVAAMAHDDGFDRITHQVLFYPSLDLDFDVDRYAVAARERRQGYGLETAGLKPFNSFYLDSGADPADPLVSPIKRARPQPACRRR